LTKWIDEIVVAMRALGGAARYSDLYELIELTTTRKLTKEWRATVRRTVEDHSSDSANFRAADVFQHVSHGHWALRGISIDEKELAAREQLAPSEVIARVFVKEHWRNFPSDRSPSDAVTLLLSDLELVRAKLDGAELVFEFAGGFAASAPKRWFADLTEEDRQPVAVEGSQAIWPSRRVSVAGFFEALKKNTERT